MDENDVLAPGDVLMRCPREHRWVAQRTLDVATGVRTCEPAVCRYCGEEGVADDEQP